MSKLKVALQKSGRLSVKSLDLLRDCGILISNGTGKLRSEASNFPLEILFLRDDDIPQYVEQQVVDIGILGENVVVEKKRNVRIIDHLGFANCRLSLAIPKVESYSGLDYFVGRKVATSYPNILSDYLAKNQIEAEIEEIGGSVEIAPGIGLAHAVCDIVSTGSTLLTNGLKEVETLMHSQSVLISNDNLCSEKQSIIERLLFRIQSVRQATINKYILLNAPNSALDAISKILPGMNSPSILPLAKPGWSSLHSVIQEDDFWDVIDRLREVGAEGILIIPIEKMIL